MTVTNNHVDAPLMRRPSETMVVTTTATNVEINAELPARALACFQPVLTISGWATMSTPAKTRTAVRKLEASRCYVVEDRSGDDQADRCGDDVGDNGDEHPDHRRSGATPSGKSALRCA
jgi:hypothetical protein